MDKIFTFMTAPKISTDLAEAQNGGPDRLRSPSKLLARLERRNEIDKAKIAAEKERLREIEAKKLGRQFRTVGEICCKAAAADVDFAAALRLVLEKGADTKARTFLRERGMNL